MVRQENEDLCEVGDSVLGEKGLRDFAELCEVEFI